MTRGEQRGHVGFVLSSAAWWFVQRRGAGLI